MLGVFVNTLTVILGTVIGILFRKFLPQRLGDAVMKGVALCVLYIGISGMLEGTNAIIAILSMACGAIVGTLIDIDKWFNRFADFLQTKLARKKKEGASSTLAEAFVSSSLLFCVGAMTIVGSLDAGLRGDNSTLYAKAVLDGISSIFFASSLGFGVLLSAATVFVYQGTLVLLAGVLQSVLTNEFIIAEMTCVGSLLIIALGLNMLGITKIKVMNYLPAIFFPILFCQFF
ncbi:MAG: DUF554 domain-containing protein [Clostridia bacterium]|nr:DUF554 domain-containing protein [Clostridia bacterium]